MIQVDHLVRRITGYYAWYNSELDNALRASIGQDVDSLGVSNSPIYQVGYLLEDTIYTVKQMVSPMLTGVAHEAILYGNSGPRVVYDQDRLEALTYATARQLETIIANQMRNDAVSARRRYQDLFLRADLAMSRRGVSRQQALMEERETIYGEYTRMDRSGRRWKSHRYIEVESKNHITNLYNEIVVYFLGLQQEFEIMIHNPGSDNHRKVLPLDDYYTVRDEEFHPNSTALVQRITY